MKKNTGFSLIELLIVVAIVPVLAAVAIPIYQSYSLKAQGASLLPATALAQAYLNHYYDINQNFSNATFAANSQDFTKVTSGNVASMVVNSGVVTLNSNLVNPTTQTNINIGLVPTINAGVVTWTCKTNSTAHYPYLPTQCQNQCAAAVAGAPAATQPANIASDCTLQTSAWCPTTLSASWCWNNYYTSIVQEGYGGGWCQLETIIGNNPGGDSYNWQDPNPSGGLWLYYCCTPGSMVTTPATSGTPAEC